MANSKDRRSENVNAIKLNCKVVKKVATPHFYINPPFQFYPPFLAKNFVPPQVTQFWGEGGSNYGFIYVLSVSYSTHVREFPDILHSVLLIQNLFLNSYIVLFSVCCL